MKTKQELANGRMNEQTNKNTESKKERTNERSTGIDGGQ